MAKGLTYSDVTVASALSGDVICPVVEETFMGYNVVERTGTTVVLVGSSEALTLVGDVWLMSVTEEGS